MVTSRDVAALAGVSQATVSRVMSGSTRISPAVHERVRAAMEELNYVPHTAARALKTQRTNTMGVVVGNLSNPFYGEMLDEATRALDRNGYRTVLWNSGSASNQDALVAIQNRAVDGVLFMTATPDSAELQAAVERRSPIVLINRVVDDIECDVVVSDNFHGGSLVADYLINHGQTRAALIAGSSMASTSRDRSAGFLNRMEERGSPVPEHLIVNGEFSYELARHTSARLLEEQPDLQAIFCVNDYMAFGARDGILARDHGGERTPWVIGYDDIEMSSWESISLTTVRQSSRDMARQGVDLLIRRVRKPESAFRWVKVACEMRIRGSTDHHTE